MLNRNMKALGVLESKRDRDPIRKKLVRRSLEEQEKVLRSYFAQKVGTARAGNMSASTCMCEEGARADRDQVTKS